MNIAIIGCGPAGLCAAITLHSVGCNVTLLEQFEEAGPVGSGLMLQPTGLAVLGALGLRQQVESIGQRIDGMSGKLASSGKTVLDIKYRTLDQNLYGIAIHRASLFQILFNAVRLRSIEIVTSARVTAVRQTADKVQPICENSRFDKHFDLIIDASGSKSVIAQNVFPSLTRKPLSFGALWTTVPLETFDEGLLEQRYVRASKMIGVLPCGTLPDNSQKLATLFYSLEKKHHAQWLGGGIELWKQNVLALWPETQPLLDHINTTHQLTFAEYSHHTLKVPAKGRVMFIGDAAHATSPQLGQGANMAFLDALALANAIKIFSQNIDKLTNHYASLRRRHVQLYQLFSYWLTPFYQSNSRILPLIRNISFKPATAFTLSNRIITSLGAGTIADPTSSLISTFSQSS